MSEKDTGKAAPSAKLFFETINAYQRTAAIKAAVELDLFTAIGEKPATATEIAPRLGASQRGVRILCDYLTILGFLNKDGDRYSLTRDSAAFLDRKSPTYAGGMTQFLLMPEIAGAFDDLAKSVRKGGAVGEGTLAPEHPVWIEFARSMGGMMIPAGSVLAEIVALDPSRETRVLDISASHGMWGISFAKKNARARITALDWAPVLKLTRESAERAGVADRFDAIAGSAFDAEFGSDYDLVLVPNFLHHFNFADCVRFLKKARSALRRDGRIAIVEFVPNPDRVSPPESAGFSIIMLATTPEGDAYTFAEFEEMLRQSGFQAPQAHSIPPTFTAIVAKAG
ncbi:MAG: methyltransferase [Alphaproteobacteria bacterium]